MGQLTLTEQQEYESFKEEMGQKLNEVSDDFVIIGYILKQVRDRQMYRHESYSDVYGFGMGAFGLSKSTVSRFIKINTKFSVGGNSREIRPEYRGYGRSKIQEMLNVDGGDMELITAEATVGQVKELKKAEEAQRLLEKEERESSLPLVRMAAAGDAGGRAAGQEEEPVEPFDMVMTAFWRENMDLYRGVAAGLVTPETAAEEICPSGSRTFRLGANMMFFYNFDCGAKLRSYAKGRASITPYTYGEIVEKTRNLIITPAEQAPETAVNHGMDAETSGSGSVAAEKPAATPQQGAGEGQTPYIPMPGQATVDGLPNVVPDTKEKPAASPGMPEKPAVSGKPAGIPGHTGNGRGQGRELQNGVIDGEFRELDGKTAAPELEVPPAAPQCPYSDIEIRNALSYFDLEYSRMAGLGQNTAKRRNYRLALDCIRKCYSAAAKKWDRENYVRTGV